MHLILSAADSRDALRRELGTTFRTKSHELQSGLFGCEFELTADARAPILAFARQLFPEAREVGAESIRGWANLLVESVAGFLPDQQTWSLHVLPFREITDGSPIGARAAHTLARKGLSSATNERQLAAVGQQRCELIREGAIELLGKRRRHLARYLRHNDGPFVEDEALVQLLLVSPARGFLSVAKAPLPFHHRHLLSCFPSGEIPVAVDRQAPSRAFAKLAEAELRLGRRIAARETCVDLGASPGGWTYLAARRGAIVTAVDRAELRADLMNQRNVRFERGDAFRFEPAKPVDWLLCDVIASAERSAEQLLKWLSRAWCRQFVVTLKVDHEGSSGVLERLKHELPSLTRELWLTRLCANKKEVCALGTAA